MSMIKIRITTTTKIKSEIWISEGGLDLNGMCGRMETGTGAIRRGALFEQVSIGQGLA